MRVVIPEVVERIEFVAKPTDGFWEKLGYDCNAWVNRTNRA